MGVEQVLRRRFEVGVMYPREDRNEKKELFACDKERTVED